MVAAAYRRCTGHRLGSARQEHGKSVWFEIVTDRSTWEMRAEQLKLPGRSVGR
jgi:hypothetical protein